MGSADGEKRASTDWARERDSEQRLQQQRLSSGKRRRRQLRQDLGHKAEGNHRKDPGALEVGVRLEVPERKVSDIRLL